MATTTYDYLDKTGLEYVLIKIHKEIEKYAKAENISYDDTNTSYGVTNVQSVLAKIEDLLGDKVDTEAGKGLSTEDFTSAYKKTLDDLATTLSNYMLVAGGTFTGPVTFNTAATATFNGTVTVPDAASGTKDGTAANTKFVDAAIADALKDITGITFDGPYASYQELVDTVTDPKKGTIYLVTSSGSAPNVSDEYFWNGTSFELFGTTSADLSNCVKKDEMISITTSEIDTMLTDAGYDITTATS